MSITRGLATMAAVLLGAGGATALTDAERCESSKLREAGKYAFCRLNAEARAVKTGRPPDYARCDAKFGGKWLSIESAGGGTCPSNGDQSAIQIFVTRHADDLAAALAGLPLPECAGDLNVCSASLGTCTTDLASCDSSLSSCSTNLATVVGGTAVPSQVLSGETFSSSAGIGLSGTMANNGAVSIIPGTAPQAIAQGYHSGAGSVAGAADLAAGNIKSGVEIFGVVGNLKNSTLRTGQTASHGSGSDGDLQKGVAQVFVDNGDGTITDTTTGLMWEKKSDDGGIHDKDNTYDWAWNGVMQHGAMVLTFLTALNSGAGFAGYTDWRIPNLNELESIRNMQAVNPATYPAFNSGCTANCTVTACSCSKPYVHWTSTVYVDGEPFGAWVVNFAGGNVNTAPKPNSYHVRAVRGGS